MKKRYCDKYDVYFNKETGKLLEKDCSDKDCDYCKNRPEKLTHEFCNECKHKLPNLTVCKGMCKRFF